MGPSNDQTNTPATPAAGSFAAIQGLFDDLEGSPMDQAASVSENMFAVPRTAGSTSSRRNPRSRGGSRSQSRGGSRSQSRGRLGKAPPFTPTPARPAVPAPSASVDDDLVGKHEKQSRTSTSKDTGEITFAAIATTNPGHRDASTHTDLTMEEIKRLQEENDTLKSKLKLAEDNAARNTKADEDQLETLTTDLENARTAKTELETKLTNAQKELATSEENVTSAEDTIIELNEKIEDLNKQIATLTESQIKNTNIISKHHKELEDLTNNIAEKTKQITDTRRQRDEFEENVDTLKLDLKAAEDDYKKLEEEMEAMQKSLDGLNELHDKADQQLIDISDREKEIIDLKSRVQHYESFLKPVSSSEHLPEALGPTADESQKALSPTKKEGLDTELGDWDAETDAASSKRNSKLELVKHPEPRDSATGPKYVDEITQTETMVPPKEPIIIQAVPPKSTTSGIMTIFNSTPIASQTDAMPMPAPNKIIQRVVRAYNLDAWFVVLALLCFVWALVAQYYQYAERSVWLAANDAAREQLWTLQNRDGMFGGMRATLEALVVAGLGLAEEDVGAVKGLLF